MADSTIERFKEPLQKGEIEADGHSIKMTAHSIFISFSRIRRGTTSARSLRWRSQESLLKKPSTVSNVSLPATPTHRTYTVISLSTR